MALVKDGAIYYLVLNQENNLIDFGIIKQINDCLDELEKTTGAACLITIGSGEKIFSTGFNLKMWASGGVIQ